MSVYAYECTLCGHLLSIHLMHADGVMVEAGPYICGECGCAVAQDSPARPLTRGEYEAKYGANR